MPWRTVKSIEESRESSLIFLIFGGKAKIAGELRTIAWLERLLSIYRSQLNDMEERTGESSADKSLQLLRRHRPLLGKCV